MKKKVSFILASVCLSALLTAPSARAWPSGSLEDALAKAKSSGKLLLLDFFQEYG
jgi:hypothetical protein